MHDRDIHRNDGVGLERCWAGVEALKSGSHAIGHLGGSMSKSEGQKRPVDTISAVIVFAALVAVFMPGIALLAAPENELVGKLFGGYKYVVYMLVVVVFAHYAERLFSFVASKKAEPRLSRARTA